MGRLIGGPRAGSPGGRLMGGLGTKTSLSGGDPLGETRQRKQDRRSLHCCYCRPRPSFTLQLDPARPR